MKIIVKKKIGMEVNDAERKWGPFSKNIFFVVSKSKYPSSSFFLSLKYFSVLSHSLMAPTIYLLEMCLIVSRFLSTAVLVGSTQSWT